jgi:putative transposase
MYKGYKFEILPSEEQKELIWKTIGCNRLVYNRMLRKKIRYYEKHGKSLSKIDIDKRITKLKHNENFDFLNEVDSASFQCTSEYLHQAYQRFFKGQNQFPKFHSKHSSHQSYTTKFILGNIKVLFDENLVQLPKLGKIDAKLYQDFGGDIKYATVSYDGNKYWVSFQVEVKEPKALSKTTQCCGIDLGVKDFATVFSKEKVDGKHCSKVENPKHLKKSQERIKFLQKNLSRKKKGSNNYVKAKKKLNKKHTKVRNQRKDFLHKLSKHLVDENQVICIEDLQVKNMIQDAPSKVRDSIFDVGFRMFRSMLEYKCNWYGRQLVVVPSNYPSSQLCWKCHHKNPEVKNLDVRSWTCPHCGCKHDRDKNAARNILTEGLRILKSA